MNEAIKVDHISKHYSGLPAVNNLSLSVGYGKVFGLLGANGAGKSTSIECILGTKTPDSGTVSVIGMNPKADRRKLFQEVGVQFQEANYQNEITVGELCEETAALYRETTDWNKLLDQFGIKDKIKSAVKTLSGGQRQRLFIVLSLIPNPKVVFLDELTTGLDTKARRDVWKILEGLKKNGLTILLTSHFMDEVEALCDEICILKHGETVFYGTVSEAIANSPYEKFEDAYLWYAEGEEYKVENY